MKKALLALTILGFTYLSADAQTTTTTTKTTATKHTTHTGRAAADTPNYAKNYKVVKGKSTYYATDKRPVRKTANTNGNSAVLVKNTENDKNFKVCKGKGDYHICDEHPNSLNSVAAPTGAVVSTGTSQKPVRKTTTVTENGVVATTSNQTFADQPTAAPQSIESDNNLAPVTIRSRVDSINNANAPYHGKNSPQYDGVEKNKARNLNTPPQSPNAIPIK